MNCPKCKNIALTKKRETSPYVCQKCKGLWLRPEQITHLDVISDEIIIEITDELSPALIRPKDGEQYISVIMPMRV